MKPATVFLGEMTNPEVEAFLASHHTVVVPIGATEQHGPHAPLLTDVLIKRRQKIAAAYLPAINPLVDFALSEDGRLSFSNAAVAAGIATAPAAGYRVELVR